MVDDLPPILDDEAIDQPSQVPFDPSGETQPPVAVQQNLWGMTGDEEDEDERVKEVFEGAPMWVVTFGDLMSLLLTFFVLLLSFSTMDPVRFKVVRGSLSQAMGIQKTQSASSTPIASNMVADTFNRRDFAKRVESFLKFALRDTFPSGQEPGKVKVDNDIRGQVVKFIAYDLFHPNSERLRPKAAVLFETLADTLIKADGRLEVRGVASERLAKDVRQRRRIHRRSGVEPVEAASRRASIAAEGVFKSRPKRLHPRDVTPAVAPDLKREMKEGVNNVVEFVFLERDPVPQIKDAP